MGVIHGVLSRLLPMDREMRQNNPIGDAWIFQAKLTEDRTSHALKTALVAYIECTNAVLFDEIHENSAQLRP